MTKRQEYREPPTESTNVCLFFRILSSMRYLAVFFFFACVAVASAELDFGTCGPVNTPTPCIPYDWVPPSTPCVYNWTYAEFSPCNVICGEGTQTRIAFCTGPDNSVAVPAACAQAPAPILQQDCTGPQGACTFSWVVGNWSQCSAACGSGYETRNVYCLASNGTIVASSACSGPEPTCSRTCNSGVACIVPPPPPTWVLGSWCACQGSCGQKNSQGTQTRTVICPEGCTCPTPKPICSQSCSFSCPEKGRH